MLNIRSTNSGGAQNNYTIPFTFTETNGNITSLQSGTDVIINLGYDTHPNPFYSIAALRSMSIIKVIDEGDIVNPINTLQKNNCTSYHSNISGVGTENEVNTYTYNSNGLPKSFTTEYTSNFQDPSSLTVKGTLEYGKW